MTKTNREKGPNKKEKGEGRKRRKEKDKGEERDSFCQLTLSLCNNTAGSAHLFLHIIRDAPHLRPGINFGLFWTGKVSPATWLVLQGVNCIIKINRLLGLGTETVHTLQAAAGKRLPVVVKARPLPWASGPALDKTRVGKRSQFAAVRNGTND